MSDTIKKTSAFESTTCSRCGGCGRYSYCPSYGDRCFKCHGAGYLLTKRGAAASTYWTSLMSVPAETLRVGDRVRVGSIVGINPCEVWITLTSVDGLRVEGDDRHGLGHSIGFSAGELVRIVNTTDEKKAKLALALAYQDTLTKTGTVRTRTKKAA